MDGGTSSPVSVLTSVSLSCSLGQAPSIELTSIAIALVEYLTSEEAGDSLQSRFAWPVSLLLTSPANEQRERSKLATKLDKSQRKKN